MEEIGDEKLEVETCRSTLVDEENIFCTPTIVVNGGYGIKHVEIIKTELRPMTEHDVFVKIFYCGINFADIYCTTGTFFQKPFPFSLGIEASGVVLKVGSKVTGVTTGDLVSIYHPNGGMLAKHAVVEEKYVFLYSKRDVILQQGNIIEHLIAAAAIPTAYLTANALIKIIGHVSDFLLDYYSRDAQYWLFHGCGGGVGLAFAVLANNFKQSDVKKAKRQIKLLGTCSEHKMDSELVRNSLYECFVYKDWDKNVSKKYGGVDVIVDTIGGTNINMSVDVLRPNGILFSVGASSALNNRPTLVSCSDENDDKSCVLNQTEVVMKNLGYYGVNLQTEIENNPGILKRVMESITREIFQKPALANVDKVYSFQDGVVALNRLLTRNNVGKVVIETEKGLDQWLRNASESTKK